MELNYRDARRRQTAIERGWPAASSLHRQFQFNPLSGAKDGRSGALAGILMLQQVADELAFGQALRFAAQTHDDVVGLKTRAFAGGVLAELADVFDAQG